MISFKTIWKALFTTVWISTACGSNSGISQDKWLGRLRSAIISPVDTREMNQDNSRLLEQALDDEALKNMMRHQLRAKLGPGESCGSHPKCSELGFQSDDWYYTLGQGDEKKIGKRPVLIVGFDTHGNVIRVWNLRIH